VPGIQLGLEVALGLGWADRKKPLAACHSKPLLGVSILERIVDLRSWIHGHGDTPSMKRVRSAAQSQMSQPPFDQTSLSACSRQPLRILR
jgi:hypothetical protein